MRTRTDFDDTLDSNFLLSVEILKDSIDKGSYVRNIKSIISTAKLDFTSPITFFTGENGSGKSTMLEALAVSLGFNPEGGTKNYNFATHESHSTLYDAVRIARGYRKVEWGYFLRAESFYNVATAETKYGKLAKTPPEDLHKMSHGESFLSVAGKHFKPNGLYLLDEPEAALSPQNQLALAYQIFEATKNGAQFIIASHSPVLLALPGADIMLFDDNGISRIKYEETESYKVTKMVLEDKDRVFNYLLD